MKEIRIIPLFIGFFLIFLGTSLFVKLFIDINIPVGRIFWGFALCYLGYQVIMNRCYRRRQSRARHPWDNFRNCPNTTIFDSTTVELDANAFNNNEPFEYRTTIGSSIIDMTRIFPTEGQQKTKHVILIDTTIGKTILKINKSCTFCIHAQGTLSNITLPDGSTMTTGSRIFCSQPEIATPDLDIHALTILGSLEIIAI